MGELVCTHCNGAGSTCEAHPWSPFPHDTCPGPGTAQSCPWNIVVAAPRWAADGLRTKIPRRKLRVGMLLADNGQLAFGQRFITHDGAAHAAEAQRQRLMTEDWSSPPSRDFGLQQSPPSQRLLYSSPTSSNLERNRPEETFGCACRGRTRRCRGDEDRPSLPTAAQMMARMATAHGEND